MTKRAAHSAKSTRATRAPAAAPQNEPAASIQMLRLPGGVYAFSIQGGAPNGQQGDKMGMPALHVGLAPVNQQAQVEFFSGPGTLERWLLHAGDRITARVSGEAAGLLLTSLRRPEDPALAIDVRRIDVPQPPIVHGGPAVQLMAHVRHLGDLHFANEVSPTAPGLWIEAMTLHAVDETGAPLLEYRGITADGFETPWLSNPVLCGSRGRAVPLVGFAARLRVDFASRYECTYGGRFGSGRRVGALVDGSFCRSDMAEDPLEGIEVRIAARP